MTSTAVCLSVCPSVCQYVCLVYIGGLGDVDGGLSGSGGSVAYHMSVVSSESGDGRRWMSASRPAG